MMNFEGPGAATPNEKIGVGIATKEFGMKKKLLILDDEKNIIDSLGRALNGLDMELITSQEPEKALELIKEHVPQVVITDLKMPKMDGLEFMEKVKEFNGN